jgi:hypothetical protein
MAGNACVHKEENRRRGTREYIYELNKMDEWMRRKEEAIIRTFVLFLSYGGKMNRRVGWLVTKDADFTTVSLVILKDC